MFGLFEYTGAHYSLQINPASDVANVAYLEYFYFIGRVIGMVRLKCLRKPPPPSPSPLLLALVEWM